MKIHEYQAKKLFKDYGINIPNSILVENNKEIQDSIDKIGLPCVIKAQVHSGARGKAGGIKLAKTREEAIKYSSEILGIELKSIQTGDESKKVRKILIEQGVNIDKELYLSMTVDREKESIVVIASTEGGMNIEEVAQNTPELINTVELNLELKNKILSEKLGLNNDLAKQFNKIIELLGQLFEEKDCSLLEINPLVITKENQLIAIDGKINFDDNALYKHSDIAELRDILEENPLEVEASKYNLNYIKLNGSIGCMVNGAGLAMATMDTVKLAGSEPANFLDVGGGASSQNIENAFKLLLSDESVKAVFINIFGGILRCDILAEGIKNAVQTLKTDIPVIVRLEGTNCEIGAEILQNSGLKFQVAKDLKEAIKLIQDLAEIK
ncbi:MAG: ADP-forming succinate--CoA ligase subunit beta [Candidatus Gastranaerophilales bacterium]|nr:ADP-forming succinate--CoA ligase subunit beta [Candidatus Gastranaerophilales bacterium]